MDADTIREVQASWTLIEPLAPRLSRVFYDHLFTADPSLVPLFERNQRGEMAEQGHKLMQMLGVAVDGLGDLDALTPVLMELGRRHVGYGVEEDHYQKVGDALMQTLAEGLGAQFTPAVRHAWNQAYELMARVMLAGARAGTPARSS